MRIRRNIGIVAHIDAGKTTLTEQILHATGVLRRPGAVEDGSTVSDWQRQEQERGITIGSAAVVCRWNDVELTLIDTPGHVDFSIEVSRALTVLDGTVVIFSGPDGVQAQTQTVWHQVAQHDLPAIGLVNKLDRPGYDDDALLEEIRERLGIEPLRLQVPVRFGGSELSLIDLLSGQLLTWNLVQKKAGVRPPDVSQLTDEHDQLVRQLGLEQIADAVASSHDDFAERYLAGDDLSRQDWLTAIARATAARAVLPLIYGVARSGAGPAQVLDAVVDLLPGPEAVQSPRVFKVGTAIEVGRHDSLAPAAFVFKTERRPRGRRAAYLRVFSGTLRAEEHLRVVGEDGSFQASQLVRLMGSDELEVTALEAGTVGALILHDGAPRLRTGQTLTTGHELNVTFESLLVPTPVISASLEAEDEAEDQRMRQLLDEFVHDDPSLEVLHDRDTGQTLLAGMGELHLELALERLQQDEGLRCRVGSPRPRMRRMIAKATTASSTCVQDGPQRGVTTVGVCLRPSDTTEIETVSWGVPMSLEIPSKRAVEAGVLHALIHTHDLVGVSVEITALAMSGGAVNPRMLWDAGHGAVLEALAQVEVSPAEPWMSVTVATPESSVGRVSGDLARRRAKILGSESRGTIQVLHVEAPLGEMIHYATALRSLTAGRGTFSMRPSRFRMSTVLTA
ncbi:MAG: GTP-binding protein [Myxococcota bacterium]